MNRSTRERILSEDALKHIYKYEHNAARATVQSIAGVLEIPVDNAAALVSKMVDHDLLRVDGQKILLTPAGRRYALQVIRAHRLWERYLADETGFAEAEWHEQADRHEHEMTPAETEALAVRLGNPTHDPHGDPIPTLEGNFRPHGGMSLTKLVQGQQAQIVHLEDEPALVYAQLVAEGLYPGMKITLTEISPHRIQFMAQGEAHVLAPVVAANVTVNPLTRQETPDKLPIKRLSDLKIGRLGQVIAISSLCRLPERNRLMDLGIVPGTTIKAEFASPFGDPTAYRVRGALIGLRHEQAALISIADHPHETGRPRASHPVKKTER